MLSSVFGKKALPRRRHESMTDVGQDLCRPTFCRVQDEPDTRIGYQFKVKDFVELEKSR